MLDSSSSTARGSTPVGTNTLPVVNPATEEVIATIAMGGPADVDAAVAAAARGVRVLVADVGR